MYAFARYMTYSTDTYTLTYTQTHKFCEEKVNHVFFHHLRESKLVVEMKHRDLAVKNVIGWIKGKVEPGK